jgi:peroxiredoxin
MKRFSVRPVHAMILLVAALALMLVCCAKKKEEAQQGAESTPNVTITNYKAAPDVELKALDGSTVRLSSFRNKTVILSILATWNKDCQAQIDELNELAGFERLQFAILGVCIDKGGKASVENFVRQNTVSFPLYYNGEEVVTRLGGVRRIPTTYFILGDGSIYRKEIGFRSIQSLKERIAEIRGQRL